VSVSSLLAPLETGWWLSLYPTAAEAGGCFVPTYRPVRTYVPGAPAADPERSRAEAARRARSKVRRYCTANRLNRLGTLTYRGSGCHDPKMLRAHVAAFFRALRADIGGVPFPYLWVAEWHKTDHGLHVHFAVGTFIARSKIEAAWDRGYVSIKRLSDLPVGSTSLHEARRAAGYLSKYVTKSFDPEAREHLAGLHRYEVAQGFQPPMERIYGRRRDQALEAACAVMGGWPSQRWFSDETEGWQGPPAAWFAWG
jgi:hypothetical protein